MKDKYSFKDEWPKIKKQLMEFSQEAKVLAKKGEKELVRFSKQGKLQMDSTTLNLKKEHLYYQIGKEYISAKCPAQQTAVLKKLGAELKKVDQEIRLISRKIKAVGRTRRKRSKA